MQAFQEVSIKWWFWTRLKVIIYVLWDFLALKTNVCMTDQQQPE